MPWVPVALLRVQRLFAKKVVETPKQHCLRFKRSISNRKLRAIIPNKRRRLWSWVLSVFLPMRNKKRQIAEKCILSGISPVRGRKKNKSAADRRRRRQRARESRWLTWLRGHVDSGFSFFLSLTPPTTHFPGKCLQCSPAYYCCGNTGQEAHIQMAVKSKERREEQECFAQLATRCQSEESLLVHLSKKGTKTTGRVIDILKKVESYTKHKPQLC